MDGLVRFRCAAVHKTYDLRVDDVTSSQYLIGSRLLRYNVRSPQHRPFGKSFGISSIAGMGGAIHLVNMTAEARRKYFPIRPNPVILQHLFFNGVLRAPARRNTVVRTGAFAKTGLNQVWLLSGVPRHSPVIDSLPFADFK
jgi:hypothetical protein